MRYDHFETFTFYQVHGYFEMDGDRNFDIACNCFSSGCNDNNVNVA